MVAGLYYLPGKRETNDDFIKVTNIGVQAQKNGVYQISGNLANKDKQSHQVVVKILFYARDNAVIGVEESQVQNVAASSSRPFRIFTTDEISSRTRHEVKVIIID